MFDIGFSELLVIAVVALLVLGPERLPKAARFAGLWVRRARTQWNSVKSEFERELADEDVKRTLRDTQDALRQAHASLRDAGSHLEQEFHSARDTLMHGPPPAAGAALPAVAAAGESAHAVETHEHAPHDIEEDDVLESSRYMMDDEPLPEDFDAAGEARGMRDEPDDATDADGRGDDHHVPQR